MESIGVCGSSDFASVLGAPTSFPLLLPVERGRAAAEAPRAPNAAFGSGWGFNSGEPKLNPVVGGPERLPNEGVEGDGRGVPNGDAAAAVVNGAVVVVANKDEVDAKRFAVVNTDDPTPENGDGGGAAAKGEEAVANGEDGDIAAKGEDGAIVAKGDDGAIVAKGDGAVGENGEEGKEVVVVVNGDGVNSDGVVADEVGAVENPNAPDPKDEPPNAEANIEFPVLVGLAAGGRGGRRRSPLQVAQRLAEP